MSTIRSLSVVDVAGLVYTSDALPGITRQRVGEGWRYRWPDGSVVQDPENLTRINGLRIPPAWTDVWISPLPNGHIQATGHDSRGRKQYLYHPHWREVQDANKFHRMAAFGHALPGLRARVEVDLSRPGLRREKVLSAAIRLMDETLIRVGNEQYERENHSFGITTLHHEHVHIEGTDMRLEFRAKSGKEQRLRLHDPRLAAIMSACQELPGQALFQYIDDHGRLVRIESRDVNDYLRATSRAVVTAKDFRTWGGSVTAAEVLVDLGPARSATDAKRKILAAIDAAAARLNNTRAVCRKSYVHPVVPASYEAGVLAPAFERAPDRVRLSHSESAVLDLVDESLSEPPIGVAAQ